MAGLGIQQSMNSLIETGTNSVTAHELFMSRFNEYYKAEEEVNNKVRKMSNDVSGGTDVWQHKTPKIKSLKDRLNASAYYMNETKELQDISKGLDRKDKITADMAKQRAEEARKQKLKEKAQARAKRPKPSTPEEVMKGVLNFHGNE